MTLFFPFGFCNSNSSLQHHKTFRPIVKFPSDVSSFNISELEISPIPFILILGEEGENDFI